MNCSCLFRCHVAVAELFISCCSRPKGWFLLRVMEVNWDWAPKWPKQRSLCLGFFWRSHENWEVFFGGVGGKEFCCFLFHCKKCYLCMFMIWKTCLTHFMHMYSKPKSIIVFVDTYIAYNVNKFICNCIVRTYIYIYAFRTALQLDIWYIKYPISFWNLHTSISTWLLSRCNIPITSLWMPFMCHIFLGASFFQTLYPT